MAPGSGEFASQQLVVSGWEDYELLDFGHGEKLERFGPVVVRRPCPAAKCEPAEPDAWSAARAVFSRNQGRWKWQGPPLPRAWLLRWGPLVLELGLRDSGQLGLFPEQAANWHWLLERRELLAASATEGTDRGLLNLFAYTGVSTLAAAAAGAAVAHVDSARSVVIQARRNAELSYLADRPVRWLVEDAVRFAQRELRRGRRYRAVVLDPPSYGHGTGRRRWQIERDLPGLLELLAQLTGQVRRLVLLTWHTRRLPPKQVQQMAEQAGLVLPGARWQGGSLYLESRSGRRLWSGYVLRAAAPA